MSVERRRTHEETHKRTLAQQTLDALLRIEETLERLRVDFLRTAREQLIEGPVEGSIEDAIVNVKPQETPFQKAVAKRPTGARKVDRL